MGVCKLQGHLEFGASGHSLASGVFDIFRYIQGSSDFVEDRLIIGPLTTVVFFGCGRVRVWCVFVCGVCARVC